MRILKNILHLDIPSVFNEMLQISCFKRQLLRFLYKEYEDPVYWAVSRWKVFYCIIDNECRKFYSKDGVLKFEEIYNLYGYHLERDTRVMFHTKHAGLIDSCNMVVRGGWHCHYTFVQCGKAGKQSLVVRFWSWLQQ